MLSLTVSVMSIYGPTPQMLIWNSTREAGTNKERSLPLVNARRSDGSDLQGLQCVRYSPSG